MPATPRKAPANKATARRALSKSIRKAAPRPRRAATDAIKLLKADHAKVDALFKKYEGAKPAQKSQLVKNICQELKIHTRIEEEIFYPELRAAGKKSVHLDDLLDEATVEQASAKALIAELEAGSPGDELYDAKVKVLGEYIRHHVKEEHSDIFPLARKRIDVVAVGQRLADRKAELMAPVVKPKNRLLSLLTR